jgi:hypothetical protein
MNHIRRIAAVLAGQTAAVLALVASSPAALASSAALAVREPPPGGSGTPGPAPHQIHAVVTGGMPGWQITLIAAGAALLAAGLAVFLDRAWATRRRPTATAA